MKNGLISILLILGLVGCIHIPRTAPFPAVPEILMEPVQPLAMLNKENIELTDIIENTNENAAKYYKLKEKYLAWQEWYTEQKKLHERILNERN